MFDTAAAIASVMPAGNQEMARAPIASRETGADVADDEAALWRALQGLFDTRAGLSGSCPVVVAVWATQRAMSPRRAPIGRRDSPDSQARCGADGGQRTRASQDASASERSSQP
ncbi:MAG: hypothetical protein V7607_6722 [Solirubrobacteraceae bacterium]